MAGFAEFKAETKALVEYGSNRLEDALVCEGLRLYLQAIGRIPEQAFGMIGAQLSGASQLFHDGWVRQIDSRCQELASIRDALWNAGCGVIKVAGEYERTDIEAMYNFDGLNRLADPVTGQPSPINGFIEPLGEFYPVTYSRGAAYATDFESAIPAAPADTMNLPGNYDAFGLPGVYPAGEPLPSVVRGTVTKKIVIKAAYKGYTASSTMYSLPNIIIQVHPGLEKDVLVGFMTGEDHGLALSIAEGIAGATSGESVTHPMANLVEPAFLSSPGIFNNRKELLLPANTLVNSLVQRVEDQTGSLKDYWAGEGGASAYSTRATSMLTYLKGLEIRMATLPTQCDKLFTALTNIRAAYATRAVAEIQAVNKAVDEYVSDLTDSFCGGSPEEIVKCLQSVYGVYATVRDAEIQKLSADITLESAVAGAVEKVSLDDLWASPLPYQGASGGDAWVEGSWKPRGDHLGSYQPEEYR